MFKCYFTKKKGVAIFLVLLVILTVVLLANIVLVLISSQYRFTQHQVGRIQAYYAGWAGINYAVEKLRTDPGWSSCVSNGCSRSLTDSDVCNPSATTGVTNVTIAIIPAGNLGCESYPPNSKTCLKVTAYYRSDYRSD